MKKLIALLLAACMLLSLAACGGDKPENPNTPDTPDDPQTPEQTTPPEEEAGPSFTFTDFGKGKITIVGEELCQDEYGDYFVRVYYDYLNMDETAAGHTPVYTLDFEVTQNGEELYVDEFSADDEAHVPEDLFYYCAVQPGIPVRNTLIVGCDPDGGVIDVTCNLMVGSWAYSEDDLKLFKFQVDPQNLRGAPKKPFEIQPITDPTYAKDLPASGTSTSGSNPFTISLDGYELTTYDGAPALRVKLTYTHQHEWEMSPYTALTINAFQDGVGLEQVSTWNLDDVTEEDEAFELDVAPGETVKCNAIFLLRGENPVEVVVEQPLDDLRAGMICNIS